VARINNALSLLVLLVCAAEFLFVPACGTPEFLFITLMTLVDVVAGYGAPARAPYSAPTADREVIGGIQ
jgi:hypothetical protein